MAIEVLFDAPQNSAYVSGLDVATTQPAADRVSTGAASKAEKHSGDDTVTASAVIVFVGLALLWFFGGYLFKNARI